VEACWAHNSEVGRSKLLAAMFLFFLPVHSFEKYDAMQRNDIKISVFVITYRLSTACASEYNDVRSVLSHAYRMVR
jgi:hypothetical protein